MKSTNDKQDFIEIQLQRYIIALSILESHGLIEEFRMAVRSPHPLPRETLGCGNNLVIETY